MTGDSKDSAGVAAVRADTSVRQALQLLSQVLQEAGIADAQTDARFLLRGVLDVDAAQFLSDPDRPLGGSAPGVANALARRLEGEPIARILGRREFYGREFLITPDVLDPRADTETLVDAVLETLSRQGRNDERLMIVDVGSGSGAIIVTLLAELRAATGIATDVSAEALAVTRENAMRLGTSDRLSIRQGRGLAGVSGRIDIVVSNPPYIATADIMGLDVGVRGYDPHLALDGGPDGLGIYRKISRDISALVPRPLVFLEVGEGQAADVEAIFAEMGGRGLGRWRDLGGKERVVAIEIHR